MTISMKQLFHITIALLCLMCYTAQAELRARWSTDEAIAGERVILMLLNESHEGEEHVAVQSITNKSDSDATVDIAFTNAKYRKSVKQDRFNEPELYERVELKPTDAGTRTEAHLIPVDITASGVVSCRPLQVTLSNGKSYQVDVPPLRVHKLKENSITLPCGTEILYMWLFDEAAYCNGKTQRGILKLMLPAEVDDVGEPRYSGKQQLSIRPTVGGQLASCIREKLPEAQCRKKGSKLYLIREYAIDLLPKTAEPISLSIPCYTKGNTKPQLIALPPLRLTDKSRVSSLPIIADAVQEKYFTGLALTGKDEQFHISATTDATELTHHKEINVYITVSGPRFLEFIDTVSALNHDKLASKWKFGQAEKKEFRAADGGFEKVVITQPMTPLASIENGIPSFVLVYMNENSMDEQKIDPYHTLVTEPILLPWASAEAGISTLGEERKKDSIYHFLPNRLAGGNGPAMELPMQLWYLLYLPGCGILLWLMGQKTLRRWQSGSSRRDRNRELTAISNQQDGIVFLKELGAFIEKNIPSAAEDEPLQQILRRRDAEAFRPDTKATLNQNERRSMLKTVKKALGRLSLLMLAAVALYPQSAMANDTAMQYYEAGDYVKAREILLQELEAGSVDRDKGELLYNIGNCQYHQDNKGEAALYYARALMESPDLREAEANLATIQKEQMAIMPERKAHDSIFTLLSEPQLCVASIICTAALLFFFALCLVAKGSVRSSAKTAAYISLAFSLLCGVNHLYYLTRAVPDITATPPQELAYIITDADARKSASNTADIAIKLPASTPVRILSTRGSLRYVETFTGVRGWVPAEVAVPLAEGDVVQTSLHIKFK